MTWIYVPDEDDDGQEAPRLGVANDDWRTRDPVSIMVETPIPVLIGGLLMLLMVLGGLGFLIGYWAH